jgi:hypothetical protein
MRGIGGEVVLEESEVGDIRGKETELVCVFEQFASAWRAEPLERGDL